MKKQFSSVEEILGKISQMNETELNQVALAVLERYRTAFPREEVIFLSLPKDDGDERRRILEYACRFEDKEIND